MRSRKEIEKEVEANARMASTVEDAKYFLQKIKIELLLDIRDQMMRSYE